MSVYKSETLTYAELNSRVVEMFNIIELDRARQEKRDPRKLTRPEPAEPYAAWEITFRADPHYSLTDTIFEIQRLPRSEIFGMWMARDEGDRAIKRTLDGYYMAVSRVIDAIPQAGIAEKAKPGEWRRRLEEDTPEAAELDDVIALLRLYWNYRRQITEKKLVAPLKVVTTGENNA